jgi:hypothetical protein
MHIGNLFFMTTFTKKKLFSALSRLEISLCSIDCEIVQHVAGDKAKLFSYFLGGTEL